MKYKIAELRDAEYREVDITEFFPSAQEKVIVKVRRLTEKKRNDVVALMMRGQSVKAETKETGEMTILDTGWFQKGREIELLNGVIIDDSFPFEKWDIAFIDELDERCPELIRKIHDAIQEFNRPLARKSAEK
jgi:hypothetical protein